MPRQGAILGRGLVTEITANRAWIEWLGAELAIPYIGEPEVDQPIWLLQQGTTVVGLASGGGNGGGEPGPPDWSDITGKPSTFPPTPQVLNWLTDVFIDTVADGQVLGYDGTTWTPMDVTASADWADIVGKPATFPPTPQNLDWLTDASGTGAIEGNLLGYASGQWVPVAPPLAIGGIAPVGTITMWPLENPPIGWLTCFGQAVSRITYPDLFSVIGTTYGAGDGSTTFNLPNFIGKFPLGARAASTPTIGDTGGTWDHAHSQPTHTHTGPSHQHTVTQSATHNHGNIGGATTNVVSGTGQRTYTHGAGGERHTHEVPGDGVHDHGGNTGNAGTGATGASGNDATGTANPPYLGIKFIIKATPGGADSGETSIAWADITGKPSSFMPIAQPLDWLTDVDTALAAEGRVLTYVAGTWKPVDPAGAASVAWADITGKPSTFPPTAQSLDWLTNVDTAGVIAGQVLGFNGTNWAPVDAGTGGGGAYLPLAGGTMLGNLSMGDKILHTVASPTAGHHVGDRAYNDTRYIQAAGDTMAGTLNMGNNELQNLPKPTGDAQPLRRQDGYSIESVTGGPTIWIGTGSPSGGNNNDVWLKY